MYVWENFWTSTIVSLLMNSTEEYIIFLLIYYSFILGGGREFIIPKAISDTSKKTHLCSFCNKTFTRNHDLKRHVQTIHAGGTVQLYTDFY